jgi:FixJ family two-component response regulator
VVLSWFDALFILPGMGTARTPMDPLISIVDDDEGSREALAVLTRSLGFVPKTFSSAAEFLGSPHLPKTACLIADVNMPGMTGVQLHRRLMRLGHAIPTILITAYPDDAVRTRAISDGAIAYLSKPCSDATLLGIVLSALKNAHP